jgi:tol-pal system protein YbgF
MRICALCLLVGAVNPVLAASVPVTDLNTQNTPITNIEQLARSIDARNQLQFDMQNQLMNITQELSELRGLVERNQYELKQMLTRQRDLYRDVDQLMQTVSSASKQPIVSDKTDKIESVTYSRDQQENSNYDKAVALILKDKDYLGATQAFEQFVILYPKSVYTTNAYYWLGQLYFSQNKGKDAQNAFEKVVKNPKASKRADALIKLALLASKNKDEIKAKVYYEQVLKEYPSSTSAKQAKKALSS